MEIAHLLMSQGFKEENFVIEFCLDRLTGQLSLTKPSDSPVEYAPKFVEG